MSIWNYKTNGKSITTICPTCGKPARNRPVGCNEEKHVLFHEDRLEDQRKWRKIDKNHLKHVESVKISRFKIRTKILTHYGGKCSCCSFDDLNKKVQNKSFLEIDHINGGGNKHRKQVGFAGAGIYYWLKSNNYPSDYRVLCRGCNNSMEPGETICEWHKWRH